MNNEREILEEKGQNKPKDNTKIIIAAGIGAATAAVAGTYYYVPNS